MSENIKSQSKAIAVLDETLELMSTSSLWYQLQDIKAFVARLGHPLTDDEMLIVLDKLIKDGYVQYGEALSRYKITFEGLVFSGYQQYNTIADQNEKRTVRNERLLVNGTWFAGGAAIVLFLWQVWMWFYPIHKDYPYWIWEKVPVVKHIKSK